MSSRNVQLPSTAAGIVVRFKLLLLLSLLDSRKGGESFVESCSTLLVRERTKRTKRKRSKHDIIASIKMKIKKTFRFRCMHCTMGNMVWYGIGLRIFLRKSKIKTIDRYVCSMSPFRNSRFALGPGVRSFLKVVQCCILSENQKNTTPHPTPQAHARQTQPL
jgi:hypothetical protein